HLSLNSVLFSHTGHTASPTLSLHDALPILRTASRWAAARIRTILLMDLCRIGGAVGQWRVCEWRFRFNNGRMSALGGEADIRPRSEEHTSELQSRGHVVCRLLLEKKNFPIT